MQCRQIDCMPADVVLLRRAACCPQAQVAQRIHLQERGPGTGWHSPRHSMPLVARRRICMQRAALLGLWLHVVPACTLQPAHHTGVNTCNVHCLWQPTSHSCAQTSQLVHVPVASSIPLAVLTFTPYACAPLLARLVLFLGIPVLPLLTPGRCRVCRRFCACCRCQHRT